MKTEHFGSKFFCGKLVTPHPEPPLFYLQGQQSLSLLGSKVFLAQRSNVEGQFWQATRQFPAQNFWGNHEEQPSKKKKKREKRKLESFHKQAYLITGFHCSTILFLAFKIVNIF